MADLGTDISTFPDLDLGFNVISGPRVLGEAIARRISTPRGTLSWAPTYGLDAREMLAGKADAVTLERWRVLITSEVAQDERVLTAQVSITLSADRLSAALNIIVVTADGPFRFVVTVDQVSTQLLEDAAAA